MELNTLRDYLSGKKGVAQEFPFGPDTLVFKVLGKMFALVGLKDSPLRINLKCDPDHAEALRAMYESVIPGYHMNKRHWNTVILDGGVPNDHVLEMMDQSYDLVVKGLKKAEKKKLGIQ